MLSDKDKQGIWLIAGVILVLIAVFAFKISQDSKPKAGSDNCVGEVSANTAVVVDHTERISDQTRDEIINRTMAHIMQNAKLNERISVFTISDLSKKSLRPLVSLCRPPEDGNRAIEDVRAIQKKFKDNFEKPIRNALINSPDNTKESPIAQALTDISLSQFLRGKSNTLLIFSDMLENTEQFSLYRCKSATSVISQYRESRRGAKERPDFINTKVVLNLIPRMNQSASTLKCRDALWLWFFGDNSGAEAGLIVDYLPGGAPSGSK